MIARLSGTVWEIGEDHLVIRVGGVGLQVRVPSGVLARIDDVGQPLELFTHLHVRETELGLFGFLTEEELAQAADLVAEKYAHPSWTKRI